jgi:hypothetical protein
MAFSPGGIFYEDPKDTRYTDFRKRLKNAPESVTREEALGAKHLPGYNGFLPHFEIQAYRNDFDREVLRRELKEKNTDPDEIEKEVDKNFPHPYPTHLYSKENLEEKKKIGEKLFQLADISSRYPKISDKIISLVVDNYECRNKRRLKGGVRTRRKQNKRKSSKQNKRRSSKQRA